MLRVWNTMDNRDIHQSLHGGRRWKFLLLPCAQKYCRIAIALQGVNCEAVGTFHIALLDARYPFVKNLFCSFRANSVSSIHASDLFLISLSLSSSTFLLLPFVCATLSLKLLQKSEPPSALHHLLFTTHLNTGRCISPPV
jgi:hypothetical protein